MSSLFRATSRRCPWKIIGLALAAWVVTVAGIFGYERTVLRAGRDGVSFEDRPADPLLKFQVSGIVRPPAVDAKAAALRTDEEVIGFVIGGRARAYRLDALRDRSRHVVNDLVGGIPVTVAYCDISDCVTAYRGAEGLGPLDVSVGGLFENREMVLEVGGNLYYQKSGTQVTPGSGSTLIPFEQLSPTRTTWGDWKRQHPTTDVYEGLR